MNKSVPYEKPTVSVIIPVWNPGPGIDRCIESLRMQTLGNIEMIFVDDCGTDDAMEKVRAAAERDPRIWIITNPRNLGPGLSRNAGMDAARGKYIFFIDPDDYIDPDYLELLFSAAETKGLDFVKGNVLKEDESGRKLKQENYNKKVQQRLSAGLPLFLALRKEHISLLIRRLWLAEQGIQYGSARSGEDSTFLLRLACGGGSFAFCDQASFYHYVFRSGSVSNSFTETSLQEKTDALKEQIDSLSRRGIDRHAVTYIRHRFYFLLSLQEYCSRIPAYEKVSERFLLRLRDLVISCPERKQIENNNFVMLALNECGVNLGMLVWDPDRRKMKPDNLLRYGQRWFRFLGRPAISLPFLARFLLRLVRRDRRLQE